MREHWTRYLSMRNGAPAETGILVIEAGAPEFFVTNGHVAEWPKATSLIWRTVSVKELVRFQPFGAGLRGFESRHVRELSHSSQKLTQ